MVLTAVNVSGIFLRTKNTPSHPRAKKGRASRTDSRTKRFSRFLPTARLSTLVGTTNANRLVSADPSRFLYIREIPSPFMRLPVRMRDLISREGSLLGLGSMDKTFKRSNQLTTNGQFSSSGQSSSFEDFTSDAGRHPGAEPVLLGPLSLLRLIDSLWHDVSISDLIPTSKTKTIRLYVLFMNVCLAE